MPLREVEDDDIGIFHQYQSDAAASALAGVPMRDAQAYAEHWAKLRADPQVLLRTIVTDEGAVAGQLLSFPRDGIREIGYWLGRQYWGRGLATASLREFLQLIPERPVYGVVTEANTASVRVLERNGFVLVERRVGAPAPDGTPRDVLVLRLDA
ncbi:MAG TPA: GNAT family N-acetyltransferase [Kineosporiaceae bacterium]|nr:GNAT family N-acetyltransferase [Kineosporiaceae bacterium]